MLIWGRSLVTLIELRLIWMHIPKAVALNSKFKTIIVVVVLEFVWQYVVRCTKRGPNRNGCTTNASTLLSMPPKYFVLFLFLNIDCVCKWEKQTPPTHRCRLVRRCVSERRHSLPLSTNSPPRSIFVAHLLSFDDSFLFRFFRPAEALELNAKVWKILCWFIS